MSGRFEEFQIHFAERQFVAVFYFMRRKFRLCTLSVNDLRARFSGEFEIETGNKIGVRMRFDDVFDFLPVRFGFVEILLNVALRINDRRLIFRT